MGDGNWNMVTETLRERDSWNMNIDLSQIFHWSKNIEFYLELFLLLW